VVFVKPLAAGDGSGSSWADASDDIQALIDISLSAAYPGINEIWAAAGTYTPAHLPPTASTTTDRDRTFFLKAGVKLYGGFAGGETARGQRDWTNNQTILSGDFNGNDGASFTNMGENAYHVVVGVNIPDNGATVLDGFTISGGNADTSGSITVDGKGIYRNSGGGMFNNSSSPVLTSVTISGNQAYGTGGNSGGGMYNEGSSPVLTNGTISGNRADLGYSGMYNYLGSLPKIRNSIIWGDNVGNNGSLPSYTYSLVEGENPSGAGNLDGTFAGNDPKFVDPRLPASAPSTEGNYRLQGGSPAIDAGSDSFYTAGTPDLSGITTDRDGNNRFNGTVDMGAYELQ
jgi:hypothetical protein